jgi:hypothetical protein
VTTSGTTNFNPSLGEAVIHAFGMCGVRPTALAQEHMVSARYAANMLQTTWSSKGVNLWKVSQVTVPLVQGQSSYSIPTSNIVMLDTYIRTTSGGTSTDRIILPVSRTEYASYPNKAQQGFPSTFWQDRLLTGLVYLWPVPDGTQTSLVYYQVEQIYDANFTGGQTLDLPTYFLEAFTLGLAYRLAITWAPERAQGLKALADEAYDTAAAQNIESSDFFIAPMTSVYWRT